MSQVKFREPIDSMIGKYGENTIIRQKIYRHQDGTIIAKGVKEAYPVENPRDYKRKPPKGEELANINLFGDISHQAAQIINSASFTEEQLAEMTEAQRLIIMQRREQLADFQARFIAQTKKPDRESPLDKSTTTAAQLQHRKQFKTLRTFIQAILRERAKNQSSQH